MAMNFGKYILLDKIATGGMAEIWLAKQLGVEGFEKLVVIKKILPHFTHDRDFVNMFLDEARIAAKLNHPNVVQIYDLGNEQNAYYIAMEYISGDDIKGILQTSIKQGHFLPIQFAANIMSQAAEGLHYAHTLTDMYGTPLDIVHRDISPQNILVTFMGTVKIVDFGIAKAATQSQETRAGTLKGKFAYMSPEQALGKKLDGRSDVFALGIVLYEITLGKRLFRSDSELKTLKMITEDPITPPDEINPKYPPALSKIVMKALEKDVSKRYQNARELHLDLEDFLKTFPKPSSSVDLSNWMRKTFADKIAEMKEKHEKLLREEPEEFVLTDAIASNNSNNQTIVSTNKTDSQVSQMGNNQLSMIGQSPIGFSNDDNSFNRSGLYTSGGFAALSNNTSSFKPESEKNKFLLIGILVSMLVIAALLTLFLLKSNKTKCSVGYTGENCAICAPGFQDNDSDGSCLPNCSLSKLSCSKGEICSDQDGIAKCYSLGGNQKCPPGYQGENCIECSAGFDKNGDMCIKKSSIMDEKVGTVIEIPIKSEPSFADIIIDDKLYKNKTDTIVPFEVGKKYKLRVEKNGHFSEEKEFTFSSSIKDFNFSLKQDTTVVGKGKLVIIKTPESAKVIFDGIEYDSVSEQLVLDKLIAGEHEVQVKASGFEPFSQTVKVDEFKPSQLIVTLKKSSVKYVDVTISSDPQGAYVSVNGKRIGSTPIKNYSIPLKSSYKFTISKSGFKTENFTKTSSNISDEISLKLNPTSTTKVEKTETDNSNKKEVEVKDVVGKGTITISTTPFTDVYLNGKKIGTTPIMKYELSEGKHTLNLKNSNEMIDTNINVIITKDSDLPQIIKFRKGTLKINTSKSPAVILNGKTIGSGAIEKELYEGNYKLILKDLGTSKTFDISIKANRISEIDF